MQAATHVRYIINSCHRFRVIDRATTLPRLRFGGSVVSLITRDSDRPIVRGRGVSSRGILRH